MPATISTLEISWTIEYGRCRVGRGASKTHLCGAACAAHENEIGVDDNYDFERLSGDVEYSVVSSAAQTKSQICICENRSGQD